MQSTSAYTAFKFFFLASVCFICSLSLPEALRPNFFLFSTLKHSFASDRSSSSSPTSPTSPPMSSGPFAPKPLPFATGALSSKGISQSTVETHYYKHHQSYATKLNDMLKANPASGLEKHKGDARSVLLAAKPGTPMFNLAAQLYNHDFYWTSLSPAGGIDRLMSGKSNEDTSGLNAAIVRAFGSVKAFVDRFSASAAGHFGSGWVWLVLNTATGNVEVVDTHDAYSPVATNGGESHIPLLVCDVWEHAYYIDYRADRPAYIKAFWNAVNWEFAQKNYQEAVKSNGGSKL